MTSNFKRRDFFKVGAAGSALLLPSLGFAATGNNDKQNPSKVNEKERTFEVTLTHNIQEAGKLTRLWVPLPLNSDYQQLKTLISNTGNYDELYQSDFDIPTLDQPFTKSQRQSAHSFYY
ncbi:transglutaminase domain-containing protein [Oligella ureolytica]